MTSKNDMTDKKHFKNVSIPQNVKISATLSKTVQKKCSDIIKNCLKTTYHDIPKDVLDMIKNIVWDHFWLVCGHWDGVLNFYPLPGYIEN